MNIYRGSRVQSKLLLLKDMHFEVEKIYRIDFNGKENILTEVYKADEDVKKNYVFILSGGYKVNGDDITIAPFRGRKK